MTKTVMQAALSRGGRAKVPGAYIFHKDQPPVVKLSANGLDQIVDVAATEAKYAGAVLTS